MIGTGLIRAPLGRKRIWPVAIAGLIVSQVVLCPAFSGALNKPDAKVGTRSQAMRAVGQAVSVTAARRIQPADGDSTRS